MNDFLLKKIQDVVVPATGCTEPVAIALNAATARDHLKGKIKSVRVKMDICLLKNAMGVGIPGVPERGVAMCVAVGLQAETLPADGCTGQCDRSAPSTGA